MNNKGRVNFKKGGYLLTIANAGAEKMNF